MEIEIKHRDNGKVLFSAEIGNMRLCIEAAIKHGADLHGADLPRAGLSRANLHGADLHEADLSRAYLSRADLYGANLYGANLYGANLRGADLSRANLHGADLHEADLSRAYLYGADLYGANLYGANLRGARGINKLLTTPLYLLLDQPGKIRAYKLVNNKYEGIYKGGIRYQIGDRPEVLKADTSEEENCAAGISLASMDWCISEYRDGYKIMICEFEAGDIAAIPIGSDGKFRVFRCEVVAEKDLVEIGMRIENQTQG